MRALTLALCFTESGLNYNVKHNGKYDSGAVGICGIKQCWESLLGGTERNSLEAGSLVIGHLLKHNNLRVALKKYKGAKKSTKEINRVLVLYKDIK